MRTNPLKQAETNRTWLVAYIDEDYPMWRIDAPTAQQAITIASKLNGIDPDLLKARE